MKEIAWIVSLIISTAILTLHCSSVYVSVTSKELKKFRFLVLALYLSLSDSALGFEYIYITILNFSQLTGNAYLYQCMLMKHIIAGTIFSSLLQTLILCIDRFNGTFVPRKKVLGKLTSNRVVVLCFVLTHTIAVIRFLIELRKDPVPCDVEYTLTPIFVFSIDGFIIALVVAIIAMYIATMIRIKMKLKVAVGQGPTEPGVANSTITNSMTTNNAAATRKHVTTLGCIILVAMISMLPRSLVVYYVYANGLSEPAVGFMWFANNVLLVLGPLLDPVIYVFRLKKYREILKKKFCSCRSSTVMPS